jgi:hypothetical protein
MVFLYSHAAFGSANFSVGETLSRAICCTYWHAAACGKAVVGGQTCPHAFNDAKERLPKSGR